MKKAEQVLGFILLLLALILGNLLLKQNMFFRLTMGIAFGYTLMRAFTGFAGSVNRAYRSGSTKLMRAMSLMFFISSMITVAFLFLSDTTTYNLWINPINLGLILGGLLFGFGMSLSSCCATGVLTDLVTGLPRAFITLVFFGLGVLLGFPVQNTQSWIKVSWFASQTGQSTAGGVFLPDLFKWDGLEGYLGAIILTGILCGITVYLSYIYEKKRKEKGSFQEVDSEKDQDEIVAFDSKEYKLISETTYNRIFAKPWTLKQGAVFLSILYAILMGVTKAGWGASTPYGIWFGKLLMVFGVSPDSIAAFGKMKPDAFIQPFFENAASVQNLGIILGTAFYLLIAGMFKKIFTSELKISFKEGLLFALGGLIMGFGTRLSNGCNVGALYTPIANFSLSGWLFFGFLVIGGIGGNMFFTKVLSPSKKLAKGETIAK